MKFQRVLSQPEAIVLQRDSFEEYAIAEPTTTEQTKPRQSYTASLRAAVTNIWRSCFNALIGSSDPIVKKMTGEGTHSLYSVYDPVTQEQVTGLSDSEVRTWLDQRYYH
ncbi:MAG: hypothetical protein AB4042_18780 [Leptolyngbyaceae cyanobacterium]